MLCAVEVASAGVLLAGRQFGYLIRAMAVTLGALLAARFWGGGGLLTRGGLGGVWWGLVAFFALRAGQSLARVVVLYRPRALAPAPAYIIRDPWMPFCNPFYVMVCQPACPHQRACWCRLVSVF